MKVLTAIQMMDVDRKTIETGTPGIDLMRNAGMEVFHYIRDDIGIRSGIVIVAGKGNNGGDGFRVAELCAGERLNVQLLLIGEKAKVKGSAAVCMKDFEKLGGMVVEITDSGKLTEYGEVFRSAQLIVDAVFGTGLEGEIEGFYADVVDMINDSGASVVAVDIPSGVDATTGRISAKTVYANYTVSFGFPKVGHIVPPGRNLCGVIQIADIGFSEDVMAEAESAGYTLTPDEAAALFPERPYNAHKGSAGRVFLLAGSVGMTGASALAGKAALRAGAGAVTVGCPASLNDILEVKMTEIMTIPLPEVRKKRCLALRALGSVRSAVKKADAVAVGPGLGTYTETSELIRRFISKYKGKIILDADGINAYKGQFETLAESPAEIVITPHYGELSRLTGAEINNIAENPAEAAKNAAKVTGCIVLLKGAPTIIVGSAGELWYNGTGNEGMATAGMGDVLTGLITGFAAQGMNLFEAAVLGAYIHGTAGDYASEERGVHSLTAGDVLDRIPRAMTEILTLNAE